MRCTSCQDYDICQDCISTQNGPIQIEHEGCPKEPDMFYFDPESKSQEWIDEQIGIAKAYISQQETEEEEQQRAEEQAALSHAQDQKLAEQCQREWQKAEEDERRAEEQAAQRRAQEQKLAQQQQREQQHLRNDRAPSPMPARPASSYLAPPAQQPARRRKSSSSLGAALLNFGTAIVKAEMTPMNPGNGGGGGYVDYSGSGTMDMSSFWAPIQSAAGDPMWQ
jgi:hypothetical protein